MKTYSTKASEVDHKWYVVDASNVPLGRLASFVATRLTGKYKPTFTPHMDNGDYIVIVNAATVGITGKKLTDKAYYHHTNYPGGIKKQTLGEVMEQDPAKAIIRAVKGMLPKNKLADERMKRLKVYAGSDHEHTAQKPETLEVK